MKKVTMKILKTVGWVLYSFAAVYSLLYTLCRLITPLSVFFDNLGIKLLLREGEFMMLFSFWGIILMLAGMILLCISSKRTKLYIKLPVMLFAVIASSPLSAYWVNSLFNLRVGDEMFFTVRSACYIVSTVLILVSLAAVIITMTDIKFLKKQAQ